MKRTFLTFTISLFLLNVLTAQHKTEFILGTWEKVDIQNKENDEFQISIEGGKGASKKEFEVVEKKYPNGKLKERGSYHFGFMHGKWEEFCENGQKKSEKYFIDEIPTGIWREWDEDGNLINEEEVGN